MRRGVVAATVLAGVLGAASGAAAQSNVLLIIADDLGVDRVGVYAEHPDPGRTPVIDQLAADGLLFRHAWSNPICTPTRAGMLTGRHAFRHGLGSILPYVGSDELALDELTIPEALPAGYRSAAVGKWHLSGSLLGGYAHPLLQGFEHHRGSISNLPNADGESAYFDWDKNVDGVVTRSTVYATTDTVDEALGLIADFGDDPWFLWVAFNAPHRPYHHPPAHLHGYDLPPLVDDDPPLFMKALTEAMDTELGRLLAGIDPAVLADTVVVFVGDNGTNTQAVTAPFDPAEAKGTVFEGGVRVPLVVKGPGVPAGAECPTPVQTTDLFATVLELAGVDSTAEDSVSLVPYFADPARAPLRPWIYSERFAPNGTPLTTLRRQAAREVRYKLVRSELGGAPAVEALYDLQADPFEDVDLLGAPLDLEQQAALATLQGVLDGLEPPPCTGPWCDHGLALAGGGQLPRLSGEGSLLPGEPFAVRLEDAAPSAVANLLLGLVPLVVPFKGGTIAAAPDLVAVLVTDPLGGFVLGGTWPVDVPSGAQLFLQSWIVDASAPFGLSASNGLGMLVP